VLQLLKGKPQNKLKFVHVYTSVTAVTTVLPPYSN
jgi:hypothetical protein